MALIKYDGVSKQSGVVSQDHALAVKIDPTSGSIISKLAEAIADVNGNFQLQWGSDLGSDNWLGRIGVVVCDADGAVKLASIGKDWLEGEHVSGVVERTLEMNALATGPTVQVTGEGGRVMFDSTGTYKYLFSVQPLKPGGKYYWEIEVGTDGIPGRFYWGVSAINSGWTNVVAPYVFTGYGTNPYLSGFTKLAGNPTDPAGGETGMLAFDSNTGNVWFGNEGVWYNGGNPETGVNPTFNSPTFATDVLHVMASATWSNTCKLNLQSKHQKYSAPVGFKPPSNDVDTPTPNTFANGFVDTSTGRIVFSEFNKRIDHVVYSTAMYTPGRCPIVKKSYWEVEIVAVVGGGAYYWAGVSSNTISVTTSSGMELIGINGDGNGYVAGAVLDTGYAGGTALIAGDKIMFAFDPFTGELWIGVNGAWLGTQDPANGLNPWGKFNTTHIFHTMCKTNYIGTAFRMACATADLTYTAPAGFGEIIGYYG
ncbi:MAG: hypothetical protein OEX12_11840 [Gammaproteobacteria bacterium]|nr:hypothetical protein [Gammaproteobacteria bacterium]